MAKEPFQSWEESNVEPARKWITEAACRMGYEQSAVTVTRIDAATLRLTIHDHVGGTEYEDIFDRRQIEGIAAGDVSIRDEASQRLKLFKLLLHGEA